MTNFVNKVTDDFYDNNTRQILFSNLTENDMSYIEKEQVNMDDFLYKRWRTIISSFTSNYYNEYAKVPINTRNTWFQKYINLPSHDMTMMPDSLL